MWRVRWIWCWEGSLDGGADGTQDYSEVQGAGLAPFMEDFVADGILFFLGNALDRLEVGWVLCNQSPPPEHVHDVRQLVLVRKLVDIPEQRLARNSSQRILDSVRYQFETSPALMLGHTAR